MKLFWLFVSSCCLVFLSLGGDAAELNYQLTPRQLSSDTYVFVGKTEDFSFENGGNIVNTAFVMTSAGVVVIDTGSSLRYGEQMRQAIAKITDKPIVQVINTHHHPDHFFGNQAFKDVKIAALPTTIEDMQREGGAFSDNMYRMTGDWMRGTEPLAATEKLTTDSLSVGDHTFKLLVLQGHSHADLALLDEKTGILFAGDLVFYNRTPTTPHADLAKWLDALKQLEQLKFTYLVVGHGEVLQDKRAIVQTREYLQWLDQSLKASAEAGKDMAEVLQTPIPEKFAKMPLVNFEFGRSVVHLYPALELAALKPAS